VVAVQKYSSRDYPGLGAILDTFRATHSGDIVAAAFGIAGPVREGVETPNLPWVIERRELAQQLAVSRVDLLNDLEANAWGCSRWDRPTSRSFGRARPRATGTPRS
jgi:glucokinase